MQDPIAYFRRELPTAALIRVDAEDLDDLQAEADERLDTLLAGWMDFAWTARFRELFEAACRAQAYNASGRRDALEHELGLIAEELDAPTLGD
jgi:hypothetical protein